MIGRLSVLAIGLATGVLLAFLLAWAHVGISATSDVIRTSQEPALVPSAMRRGPGSRDGEA